MSDNLTKLLIALIGPSFTLLLQLTKLLKIRRQKAARRRAARPGGD